MKVPVPGRWISEITYIGGRENGQNIDERLALTAGGADIHH